jgi:cell division protein FtsW (lipid II flippase)
VVHSDFVFAAVGEEWGLLGVVTVIAAVAALCLRGLRAALRYPLRSFRSLLAVGLSLLLAVQSIMIMGGVLKLLPLTGVTLPFFSYGGSSLLVSFVALGLLLRLSAGED